MSDETLSSSPASADNSVEPAPRVRRISNPRIKKPTAAKKSVTPEEPVAAVATVAEAKVVPEPKTKPEPKVVPAPNVAADVGEGDEFEGDSSSQTEWPDAETVSDNSGAPGEAKRKRRRRKGKGGQNSGQPSAQTDEASGEGQRQQHPQQQQPRGDSQIRQDQVPRNEQSPRNEQAPRHEQPQRVSPNAEILAKKAWKIFLAEVSEEGVALISDHDARELSRRCFRLAEIFIEEQNRRR